jgi:NAD-dependent SIR2 family protein deacetylase
VSLDAEAQVRLAAGALSCATALVVTTGGVLAAESGIADLRDADAFGAAFPALRALGLSYADVYTPRLFKKEKDARLAWGFHAERRHTYRSTAPHALLTTIGAWANAMKDGAFALTSNADGHLHRAYFRADRVLELSGNAEWLQCVKSCGAPPFPGGLIDIAIDPATSRARPPLPKCPQCDGLARPNVMLLRDEKWDSLRAVEQEDRLNEWLADVRAARGRKLIVVECGVDASSKTMRTKGERIAAAMEATLVRIHPCDARAPRGHVGVELGVGEAIEAIDRELRKLR